MQEEIKRAVGLLGMHQIYTLFPGPLRHTVIFSLGILEKNKDECILILVIYWKKTGLLHTKIGNHLFIIETQKIVVTATKIIFMVVFTRCVTFFIQKMYGYL